MGPPTFGGTTSSEGSNCCDGIGDCDRAGTVFSLDVGLPSLVKTVPIYGIIGQDVRTLGNNLTGATVVSFHGIPTRFTVVSDTEIDATVPVGAITGTVHVTTAATMLASYPVFHVMPQIKGTSPTSGPVGTLVTITGLSLTPVTRRGVTLICPFCKSKPGYDCLTTAGGYAALHLQRIAAAATKDKAAKDSACVEMNQEKTPAPSRLHRRGAEA